MAYAGRVKFELADVVIAAVVMVLLVGLLTLAGVGRDSPIYLVDAFKPSLGAVLGRAPTTFKNGRSHA